MFGGNGISLSDIAAVTDGKNSGSWGDGNGWWILIILFALFGWGRGGYGNQGDSSSGGCGTQSVEAALQRGFDNQGVTNKLNGLENGLCSLGYDQLAQMNTINSGIATAGYNIQNAIQQTGYTGQLTALQNQNALQAQIQQCCCGLEAQLAQANYQRATDTCAITTAIQQANQAAMQNCNANYRALHDELVDIRMQGKDEQIAQLQAALNKCDLRSSQAEQNAYLINALRPAPVPAFSVPNPYIYNGYSSGCCGQNGWGVGF